MIPKVEGAEDIHYVDRLLAQLEAKAGLSRPVLVHASGFRQSPYADVRPAGGSVAAAPRKLWHSSPGSTGR